MGKKSRKPSKNVDVGVVVDRSSLPDAGRGVLATRKFAKDEYVCLYDGIDVDRPANLTLRTHEFSMDHPKDPNTIRLGHEKPRRADGVGQLINDGACIMWNLKDDEDCPGVAEYRAAIRKYNAASAQMRNVYFTGTEPNFRLHALRAIQPGEELFMHYGADYWLMRVMMTCGRPMMRTITAQMYDTPQFVVDKKRVFFEGRSCDEQRCGELIQTFCGLGINSEMWDALEVPQAASNAKKLAAIVTAAQVYQSHV